MRILWDLRLGFSDLRKNHHRSPKTLKQLRYRTEIHDLQSGSGCRSGDLDESCEFQKRSGFLASAPYRREWLKNCFRGPQRSLRVQTLDLDGFWLVDTFARISEVISRSRSFKISLFSTQSDDFNGNAVFCLEMVRNCQAPTSRRPGNCETKLLHGNSQRYAHHSTLPTT